MKNKGWDDIGLSAPLDVAHFQDKNSFFLVPRSLASYVPKKTKWPKEIFFGHNFRHHFFRKKFANICIYNEKISTIETALDYFLDKQNSGTLNEFSEIIMQIKVAEELIDIFTNEVNTFQKSWLWRLFYRKTWRMIVEWERILHEQKNKIFTIKNKLDNVLIKQINEIDTVIATYPSELSKVNLKNIFDYGKSRKESRKELSAVCQRKLNPLKAMIDLLIIAVENNELNTNDLVNCFLEKCNNFIATYLNQDESLFILPLLQIMGQEFVFTVDVNVFYTRILSIFITFGHTQEKCEKFIGKFSQQFILPKVKERNNTEYDYAYAFCKSSLLEKFQAERDNITLMMMIMHDIFVEKSEFIMMDDVIHVNELQLNINFIHENLANLFNNEYGSSEQKKILKTHINQFIENHSGENLKHYKIISMTNDHVMIANYLRKHLEYLMHNKDFKSLKNEMVFCHKNLSSLQIEMFTSIIQSYIDNEIEWNEVLYQALYELAHQDMAFKYLFKAYSLILTSNSKDAVKYANYLTSCHLPDLFAETYQNLARLEIKIFLTNNYQFENVYLNNFLVFFKEDSKTKRRLLLRQHLIEEFFKFNDFLLKNKFMDAATLIQFYFYNSKTECTYDRSEYNKFIAVCFEKIKFIIKMNISQAEFTQNELICNEIRKFPNEINKFYDLNFLSHLCFYPEWAYLSWYDKSQRVNFHRLMKQLFFNFKDEKSIALTDIAKLGGYMRLWEFETDKYSSGIKNIYCEYHLQMQSELAEYYALAKNNETSLFKADHSHRIALLIVYFQYYFPAVDEISNQLQFLIKVCYSYLQSSGKCITLFNEMFICLKQHKANFDQFSSENLPNSQSSARTITCQNT